MAEYNDAQDLAALWASQESRFKDSRRTIELCGQWARNEVRPHIPAGWEAPDSFRVMLPHAMTMGQDVASFVARKIPAFKRTPLGSGSRAGKVASKVEEWLTEALFTVVKIDGAPLWETLCAFSTNDAEFGVVIQPAASHYAGMLTFRDEEGEILANWRRNKDGDDEATFREKRPRAEYRVDRGRSREAFDEYERAYKGKRFPFVVRIIPAGSCLPIGRDPMTGRVDTMLIRSERTVSSLKADGFQWFSEGEATSRDATYTLYELWSMNSDDSDQPHVRVAYQIVGINGLRYPTRMNVDGQAVQATIDLTEEYGLREVPAGYFYGWSRKHETDPNKKGIPLLFPFLGVIAGANQALTSKNAHLFLTGFGGWGTKLDKEFLAEWIEMGRPFVQNYEPMKNHILLGEPRSLVHQGSGPEANEMIQLLIGLVERFSQSDAIKGDPSNSSIGQMVSASAVDTVLNMIQGGAKDALQFIGMCLLEQVAALAEKTGGPIPVYCHVNAQGDEQRHVELGATDLDGDFTVDVFFPQKKGQDLARAQAGVSWVESGRISEREWREDFYGDEQPERALDEIAVERYQKTDEVQATIIEMANLILGKRLERKKAQLIEEGALTRGAVPTALMPPRPGGAPPQNGVESNGVPTTRNVNPAASALGGIVGGAMQSGGQAQVVAATGAGAETAIR